MPTIYVEGGPYLDCAGQPVNSEPVICDVLIELSAFPTCSGGPPFNTETRVYITCQIVNGVLSGSETFTCPYERPWYKTYFPTQHIVFEGGEIYSGDGNPLEDLSLEAESGFSCHPCSEDITLTFGPPPTGWGGCIPHGYVYKDDGATPYANLGVSIKITKSGVPNPLFPLYYSAITDSNGYWECSEGVVWGAYVGYNCLVRFADQCLNPGENGWWLLEYNGTLCSEHDPKLILRANRPTLTITTCNTPPSYEWGVKFGSWWGDGYWREWYTYQCQETVLTSGGVCQCPFQVPFSPYSQDDKQFALRAECYSTDPCALKVQGEPKKYIIDFVNPNESGWQDENRNYWAYVSGHITKCGEDLAGVAVYAGNCFGITDNYGNYAFCFDASYGVSGISCCNGRGSGFIPPGVAVDGGVYTSNLDIWTLVTVEVKKCGEPWVGASVEVCGTPGLTDGSGQVTLCADPKNPPCGNGWGIVKVEGRQKKIRMYDCTPTEVSFDLWTKVTVTVKKCGELSSGVPIDVCGTQGVTGPDGTAIICADPTIYGVCTEPFPGQIYCYCPMCTVLIDGGNYQETLYIRDGDTKTISANLYASVSVTVTRCGTPVTNTPISICGNSTITDNNGQVSICVEFPYTSFYPCIIEILGHKRYLYINYGQSYNVTWDIGGKISGTIKECHTGYPIEGATVYIYDVNDNLIETQTTSSNGYYISSCLESERYYYIIVSKSGYSTEKSRYYYPNSTINLCLDIITRLNFDRNNRGEFHIFYTTGGGIKTKYTDNDFASFSSGIMASNYGSEIDVLIYQDIIYIVYWYNNSLYFIKSLDNGNTFSNAVTIAQSITEQKPALLRLNNGTFKVFYQSGTSIVTKKSIDDGITWQ